MPDRKQEILAAALALADERGLDAVSMRAVAERVGVTPMALYPHVGSKAALLDAMMGRLGSEMLPPPRAATGPAAADQQAWRQWLREIAYAARDVVHRHPWAATLIFSRPSMDPDAVRVTDLIYSALLAAGVPPAKVPRYERLVSTFVVGYAASEAGGRFSRSRNARSTRGDLPEGPLPGHAQLRPYLTRWDSAAEFDADLDDLERLIDLTADPIPEAPPSER
jgi:AcrR family transcriptional regulator